MYLHSLRLQAIGPYPDLVEIDFAALAASGVFLLEGPTGSGKSTIIDAVVFALYGGLAGSASSADRLHSQHADPSVEPFVELVFETGAGVFRVRRTPQYDRPKQRGAGTVKQQSSARLSRLAHPADPAGQGVSDRAQEVGDEITRIVGLNRAQFLQTVVLPQGEFARFLQSPGEDRRKLLQSLFGTELYDRTAAELAERSRTARAQVDAADARVRDALSRFEQAAGATDLAADDVPRVLAELVAASSAAAAEHAAARSSAAAAVAARDDAERRDAAARRRAALLERRSTLIGRTAELDGLRTRLADAERSGRVTDLLDGLAAARSRAAVAAGQGTSLRAAHGIDAEQDVAAVATAVRAATAEVRHLVPVEQGLDGRRAALARLDADRAALHDRAAELATMLDERPAERAVVVAAAARAAELATDAGPAQRALDDARALDGQLDALAEAHRVVASTGSAVAAARAVADRALAHESDLRARRIAGLAGELGARLGPDDACPVCGSLEHPRVAVPQADHPTPQAIETAADARAEAERALLTVSAELAVARTEADRLSTAVGPADRASVAEQLRLATERCAAASAAAAQVAALEQRRTAFDEATRALEADRSDVVARLASSTATAESDRARLDADAAAVEAGRRGLGAVVDDGSGVSVAPGVGVGSGQDAPERLADVIAALDERGSVLVAVAEADRALVVAERDVAARSDEVARSLAANDFVDADAARAASLAPGVVDDARRTIAAAEQERAVVDAGLAEPDVVAAADHGPVDLAGPRAAADSATERAEAAARHAVESGARADASQGCAEQFDRAAAARDTTSARSRAVVRLADIAAGVPSVNPTGITLGTYVLMRRFEDVVAAANDRLRAMLSGRFALETSDERESGSRARRTGLALAVRDHTTDTTRDPRSLSGGETFTVSLCLALGLADVVQAEAGGVSLGTLFVDEGFGTLDPESLDDVVGQLSRLTAGGRQVGIVSHVDELKQRIPERIAVRRSPDGGSRVTTTV